MMSGYTDRSVTTEPALASADMFLQKPFVNKSLLAAIRNVLDGKSNRY
jgi:FixJ family two-component response regulator